MPIIIVVSITPMSWDVEDLKKSKILFEDCGDGAIVDIAHQISPMRRRAEEKRERMLWNTGWLEREGQEKGSQMGSQGTVWGHSTF